MNVENFKLRLCIFTHVSNNMRELNLAFLAKSFALADYVFSAIEIHPR
jgi:hypothetical protein